MERVLNNDEKIRKAEEIYYRRKKGIPISKFSKIEGEKKSYLGSKILLQILIIANLSIIIIGIQNKDYIFTENFLKDIENYNINITKSIKEFIGIDIEEKEIDNEKNEIEEIVPNVEEQASSLNQMEQDIAKIKEITTFRNPIESGVVTSRFGNRESVNRNIEGYHTGIDIGADKGSSICAAISRKSDISF